VPDLQIPASKLKPKQDEVADSWEDEAGSPSDRSSDGDGEPPTYDTSAELQPQASNELQPQASIEQPAVPPPTPSSPTSHTFPYSRPTVPQASPPRADPAFAARDRDARRPDKSAATAARLIAGALGVRPPRMTAEQREYEGAVREKERRRREAERERVREEERRKAAVWEE